MKFDQVAEALLRLEEQYMVAGVDVVGTGLDEVAVPWARGVAFLQPGLLSGSEL